MMLFHLLTQHQLSIFKLCWIGSIRYCHANNNNVYNCFFQGDFDNRLVIYLTFGLILSFFVFVH